MATGTFRATFVGADPAYHGEKGEAHGATTLGMDDTHLRERGWTPEKWWEFTPHNASLNSRWCSQDELELGGYVWDPPDD